MSTTLNTSLNLYISGDVYQPAGAAPPGRATVSAGTPGARRFQNGNGTGQLNVAGGLTDTLSASGNADIDLSGDLTDGLGNVIAPTSLVYLAITNHSTTVTLTLKKAASNGLVGLLSGTTDSIAIGPGLTGEPNVQIFSFPRGLTITPGTGDKINIANPSSTTEVDYEVALYGRV